MDKDIRNNIREATEAARKLLTEDFAEQILADFNIQGDGRIDAKPRSPELAGQHAKIIAAIQHKRAAGYTAADAVADYLRDAAFTTLNRFVALKMLEARELVQQCVTKGEESSGYGEFCGLMPGLRLLPNRTGYRLYIESLFDELSTEVKVLFDRRDPAAVLWPGRSAFDQLLIVLNDAKLAGVWGEDETIGWVYQFFNSKEERAAMRDTKKTGSQAPRNSRELAVRNQFFTPRYVVQFLTDNTLGRIWYEMHGTQTRLTERCDYMVRKPDEVFAARSKKDPRDIRVLDPACGSGHFLLYAFDLLLSIYEEAHADPESPVSEATGRTLAADYPSIEELRRAIPALILAHNLYGVDIDPRCAQIAPLALWMRAQRAFRDFGIARDQRRRVRKSNIVVAEPLIADEETLRHFLAGLRDEELERIFSSLIDTLKLAGEMGLLLRLETLVAPPVERNKTGALFAPAEVRIRAALLSFISSGATVSTQRRMFVDDAAHGIGLLEAAERRYDVVMMNPPFGDGCTRAKKDFDRAYPRTKNDIYAAFVERGIELLTGNGMLGAITSRTGFFLSSFRKWREEMILRAAPPTVFADLGIGVMDAALVESAAYCLQRTERIAGTKTTFLRVLEELNDKASALRRAISSQPQTRGAQRYEVDPADFSGVPGAPFAYWVTEKLRSLFKLCPSLESGEVAARQGLASGSDFRFVRSWLEVPQDSSEGWMPYAKGGKYSPFYDDLYLVVNWAEGGRELTSFGGSVVRNPDYYCRPGLTWPRRTKSELSMRAMPRNCVFGDKGPAIFVNDDNAAHLLALVAIGSSRVFRSLVEFQLAAADAKRGGAARSYEVGVIQRTPVPQLEPSSLDVLSNLAIKAWSLKRKGDATSEISHAFTLPSVIVNRFDSGYSEISAELATIQESIEAEAFKIYGVEPDDLESILSSSFSSNLAETAMEGDAGDDVDEDLDEVASDEPGDVELLGFSWLVGVALGRFDPRLATGERSPPPTPSPFDPLPARSPAMWPAGDPAVSVRAIAVDDIGHGDDLATIVADTASRVGIVGAENLRKWLAREFFPLHIKMYSKSRRKAPIYWQLSTPSANYSVWLYIHAFNRDTLFRVQNDYAATKLRHEERKLESLRQEHGTNAGPAERRAIADQEAFVDELRGFLEEVLRVTPLWNPNLDDGVLLNFAPLWRLVPQNRTWQKELKTAWDGLCNAEYDWSHLAMHLWPERVVPKCVTDRSVAIAHGLEAVFWVKGADGKWTARATPTRSVAELVQERSSPAVKAALTSLLEAPTAAIGRVKRGRAAKTITMDML